MSVEYYYYNYNTREYVYLGCRSCENFYEELLSEIESINKKKKTFNDFVYSLTNKKKFTKYFEEDGDFEEFNQEDFLKDVIEPLFNWIYSSLNNNNKIKVISDYDLQDEAVKRLFKDKGYDYEAEKKKQRDYYSVDYSKRDDNFYENAPENIEEKLIDEFDKEHCRTTYDPNTKEWIEVEGHDGLSIVDYYLEDIGDIYDFKYKFKNIEFSFSTAINEMLNGHTIWLDKDKKYFCKDNKIFCDKTEIKGFSSEEILSNNWHIE